LVAVSLQVSRKPAMRKVIALDQARIFRQRLSEWLCKASSGPCDFPGRKEFFQEIELNPEQQQQLLKALEEVLRETGIPETNQQELLSRLSKS
jgi:ferric-dicitrate binding protein FerR (iron transport regulator)